MIFIVIFFSILNATQAPIPVSWEQLMQEGRSEESYNVAKQQLSGPYTDFYLGLIAQKNKKFDVSVDHLTKAISQSPDILDYVSISRGLTYFLKGDLQLALDDFIKAEKQARTKYTHDVTLFYQAEVYSALK
ncbi:hypothetical protein K2X05_07585, partial [bacterium]|nr:hypothetical protein [bacterium]